MRDLCSVLQADLEANRPVAYCRLVETRGSTPQKAGATMLVYPSGNQAGTLGGGCVEAEVKRRALQILDHGTAQIITFSLDHDYGWDDGLICGGRMSVLVDPVRGPNPYYSQLLDLLLRERGCTEVVAFDTDKSGLPAPTRWLLNEDDQPVAALPVAALPEPGGSVPDLVQSHVRALASRPRPYAAQGVAYLPLFPRCRLIVVGAGHVGQAVAQLAAEVDFDVWVVDDRAQYANAERFPRASKLLVGDLDQVLPTLAIDQDTYCLIVTRGHNHDEEALYLLAERGARYVGLIGSRRKIRMIFDDLLAEGVSQAALEQVYAPVGMEIGSQTVLEIAISILAELIAHRNCQGVVPGRFAKVALHGEE